MSTCLATVRALVADPTVEVVVSDLDGVLRRFDPELWTVLAAEAGLTAGAVYRAILGGPFLDEVTQGRATHAQWREHATQELAARGAAPGAARDVVARWADTPATVDETVASLLREAREHGCAVFVFTNGTDRVAQEMTALGLDEFTAPSGSHLLNSAELGAKKPDREAFVRAHARIEHVLGRAVAPQAVAFWDDSASHVEGARRFGWRAVRWDAG